MTGVHQAQIERDTKLYVSDRCARAVNHGVIPARSYCRRCRTMTGNAMGSASHGPVIRCGVCGVVQIPVVSVAQLAQFREFLSAVKGPQEVAL